MNPATPDHIPAPAPASTSGDPASAPAPAPAPDLTQTEHDIRRLCAEVLSRPPERIKLHRSFVAQGGDSLLAIKLMARCRGAGYAIDLRDLLQASSIREFCACVVPKPGPDPAREEVINATASSSSSSEGAESPTADASLSDGLTTPPSPSSEEDELTVPSGLTPEKVQVLSEALPNPGLYFDDVQDVYPCSPIQQGILVSQAKCPSAYLIHQCFEVRPLGPSASPPSAKGIAEAWQTLIDRHSILRTVFISAVSDTEHGLYDQLVLKRSHHHGKIHQLQCGDDEIESRLAIKTDISVGGPAEPGHELTVYSTPSGRVYAQLVISHALVDGNSLGLLQSELIQAYDGILTSKGPAPSYGAYVSYLQQTPASDSVRYWSGKLAAAEPCHLPPLTDSGFRHEAPSDPERRPPLQIATRDLDTAAVLNLQALAKTHGITTATVFQLAWALVLAQYTGSQDVSFGYPTSGRDAPIDGVDDLVGPLINIVVARTQLDSELLRGQNTKQALQRVQADFLDGLGHQRAALVDVLHALRLEGQSLFNTSLSYRHAPLETADGASIALDLVTVEDPTEYDANVHVLASGDKIQVMLRCSPLFMSADGASRVLGSLLQAVRSVLDSLDAPLGSVRVVAEDDVARMCKWNATTPDPERTGQLDCIPHLVHAQRLSQPDATAICAWDGDMTYRELEDAADRLARHLSEDLRVGPDVMVAVCIGKSRWAVVAQLAGNTFL
jgi:aryl carrier-like protein